MTPFEELPLQRAVLGGEVEIHHVQQGEGIPLVFVHGGMGDWTSWAPQWDAFRPHYRCLAYSRRYSSPNANRLTSHSHSVLDEANDLEALLDHWGTGPAVLVGTSYGAYTALQVALQAPDKVRALALTEPPVLAFTDRVPGGGDALAAFQREVLEPSNEAFAQGRYDLAVRILTQGINGSGPGEASTPEGKSRRLKNANAMRALAMSSNPYPALDEAAMLRLAVPTLLLSGANTPAVHRATFEAVRQRLPQAHVVEIADSGHGVHRDAPEAFNRVVLGFLSGCLARV